MKAITANRLSDGLVVYLDGNDKWTEKLSDAARIDNDESAAALAAAQSRVGEITDAYLIDVNESGAPEGRTKIRETIRKSGPTVRADLGYQAAST